MSNDEKTFDLIAPVPIVHVAAAIDVARQHGSIVLGSNDFDVMRELEGRSKAPNADPVFVWLYVSKTGEEMRDSREWAKWIGQVALFGKVGRVRQEIVVKKDRAWLALRPKTTTETDTPWAYWWEILDVARVEPKPRSVRSFRKLTGRHLSDTFAPHGPTKIAAEPTIAHPASALKLT